jgi:hypothetical protein
MGAFSVAMKISGDDVAIRKLKNLGLTWLEWKDALDDAGKNIVAYSEGQVFASMGGVFGTPWQALSPSTQAQKQQHYPQYAAVPLMRTGAMSKAFDHTATAIHLEVVNNTSYFKYHQSEAPREKIPRRQMFGINNDIKEIVRKAFHKAALKKLAGL